MKKELMRPVVIDNVISSGYQQYIENTFDTNFPYILWCEDVSALLKYWILKSCI